jgi:hypothetical protein
MDEDNNVNKTLWFVAGYFVAIMVMMCADYLTKYLASLESSGVIVSPNGASETERDEKVAEKSVELIREYSATEESV